MSYQTTRLTPCMRRRPGQVEQCGSQLQQAISRLGLPKGDYVAGQRRAHLALVCMLLRVYFKLNNIQGCTQVGSWQRASCVLCLGLCILRCVRLCACTCASTCASPVTELEWGSAAARLHAGATCGNALCRRRPCCAPKHRLWLRARRASLPLLQVAKTVMGQYARRGSDDIDLRVGGPWAVSCR